MSEAGMGNQRSTPLLSNAAPSPGLRPKRISSVKQEDSGTTTSSAPTNSTPVDFFSAEIFPQKAQAASETMRPLPPPKSRAKVRQEAKRARDVVDLCGDAGDAVPTAKRTKTGTEVVEDQNVRVPTCSSRRPRIFPEQPIDSAEAKRLDLELERIVEADSCGLVKTHSGAQTGDASAENAQSASKTSERKKKKLFGTLGASGIAAEREHQTLSTDANVTVCEKANFGSEVACSQAGNSASKSAKGDPQLTSGHRPKKSRDQSNSLFVDEGYGSFPVPGADDDDLVPENEDDLMKRINDSLGLSSPFVQNRRAKANKNITPRRAYAEKQRQRDAAESKRMREANLTAKEQKSKHIASGGGGLSVGVLEDIGPEETGVDTGFEQRMTVHNGDERIEHEKGCLGLTNGDNPRLSNLHSQFRPVDARRDNAFNQRNENLSHVALLDIAENYIKSTGRNGSVKADQRSSKGTKPSVKAEADTASAGLKDRNETSNGFIQLLEQQQEDGENGGRRTTGASDLASRQSIISQLTPKRKKRQDVSTTRMTLSSRPRETYDRQLSSEARLLELRNAPTSSGTSSTPKSLPAVKKQGSLLDQLVKRKEEQMTVLAESPISEQESHSTRAQTRVIEPWKEYDHHKRAKATVEAAEAALVRMGLSALLFNDWKDERKCTWASRENEFKGRTEELKELVAAATAQQDVQQNANLTIDSSRVSTESERQVPLSETGEATRKKGRKPYEPSKPRVEAAIALLSNPGWPASVIEGENGQQRVKWATKYQQQPPTRGEVEATITRLAAKQNARNPEEPFSEKVAAAEAVLRDMRISPSLTANWSYQKKVAWAAKGARIESKKRQLENFIAGQRERETESSSLRSSTKQQGHNHQSESVNESTAAAAETAESEESEEEEGWQYAIRWQGTEQPKNLADTVPLNPVVVNAAIVSEERESEDEDDNREEPESAAQSAPGSPKVAASTSTTTPYQNRQAPDEDLLRQMQRKRLDDWSDEDEEGEKEEEQVHEYVVKAEGWGMASFPADQIIILGRYLDKNKAEETVRDFILNCKPNPIGRELEIYSVWSAGNFSQKLIRDGEAGFRAFVEPKLVPACRYPDLSEKVARRKTYAVLWERTISRTRSGGDGESEEDIDGTRVDDMQVFTTKSLANWEAKTLYHGWYKEHLSKPQDKGWLLMYDEDLCKQVEELNAEGMLFSKKEHFKKGGATETMKVWVKEIAPKGPRN